MLHLCMSPHAACCVVWELCRIEGRVERFRLKCFVDMTACCSNVGTPINSLTLYLEYLGDIRGLKPCRVDKAERIVEGFLYKGLIWGCTRLRQQSTKQDCVESGNKHDELLDLSFSSAYTGQASMPKTCSTGLHTTEVRSPSQDHWIPQSPKPYTLHFRCLSIPPYSFISPYVLVHPSIVCCSAYIPNESN